MHKLGVIVPYRNRDKQLRFFLREVPKYLEKRGIPHEIIVSEQMDEEDFNRGALLNAGVLEAERLGCDYVAFHDVDLIPRYVDYSYSDVPLEMVGKIVDDSYEESFQVNLEDITDDYFGGVVIFPLDLFKKVNGYSNKYQGWGFEDNDLLKRCEECQVPLNIKNYRQLPGLEPALTFNGKDSYAEILTGKINLTKRPVSFLVTFKVWNKEPDLTNIIDEQCIFSIPGRDLCLCYTNYGTYKFDVFDNYGDVYSIHTKKLPTSLACQAVITIDPGRRAITFYLNGVRVGYKHYRSERDLVTFSDRVYLGVDDPKRKHAKYLQGQIADFAIYDNKLLSSVEVAKLFSSSYLGLGSTNPTYWMTAKITNGDLLVPTNGTRQSLAAAYKCPVEPMVSLYNNYGITIPLSRKGIFSCQRHSSNSGTLGYWKQWCTRLNQARFWQTQSLGTYRLSDGLSTIETVARIQSEKLMHYTHVKVYFLAALPKLR